MQPSNTNHLLHVLTRAGVLIHVSIHYWRGCKKLKPEDLGLDPGDISDRLISLGHKRLLPKDALAELALVEGRAHAMLDANTFQFLNGIGHFLPNAKLSEITDKLKELENQFWSAKERFLEKYSTLRKQAEQEWKSMAEKLNVDSDHLLATIESSFPSARDMDRYFGFDVQLFQINLPEKLSMEVIAEADQQELILARQKAAQEAAAKIRKDTESFVADCVATMRQQTAQLCHEMLQSINSCETGVLQTVKC